jgi:hypothetical protein
MATFSDLKIVFGSTEISLLRGEDGFFMKEWRPAIAQYKAGGTWQSSPLADGRRLVNRQWNNAIESFVLTVAADGGQNELIDYTQDLFRVLEAASSYWASEWAGAPVYLHA